MKSGTSGWARSGIGLASIAMVVLGAARVAGRAQENPPSSPAPAPAAASVDERVARLEQVVLDQRTEIDRLHRIVAGLVDGSQKLSNAAEQALIKGFVSAGPNPDARIEILNGLSAFAESVKVAVGPATPVTPPAPADAPPKKQ